MIMNITKHQASKTAAFDSKTQFGDRDAVAKYWRETIANDDKLMSAKGSMVVIAFSQDDHITGHYRVTPGEMKPGHLVRAVFGQAIAKGASYIVIGRSSSKKVGRPTGKMIEQARYLQNVADFLEINLADYTIFGPKDDMPVLDIVNGCQCHESCKCA